MTFSTLHRSGSYWEGVTPDTIVASFAIDISE